MRALVLTCLAACSVPTKHLVAGDAQGSDSGEDAAAADTPETPRDAVGADGSGQFACIGHEHATTAPAAIVVTGTVRDAFNNQPAGGVPVQGIRTDMNSSFMSTTTDPTGSFTSTVLTGGTPIPGKLVAGGTGASTLVAHFFPSRPFDGDTSVSITSITGSELQQLYAVSGVPYDPTQATALATIVDCNGAPLQAARLTLSSTSPNGLGHIYYFNGGLPDTNASETDATGRALVLGLTAGSSSFSASRAGVSQFLTYSIAASGGAIYELVIQP